MSSKLKTLCASLILLAMSACAAGLTAPEPGAVSDYCRIARPISYDASKDTPETVRQVEAHNSQYVCVCENDCPRPG